MEDSGPSGLLRVGQAAQFLSVTPRRAYQLAREGRIPVVKVGRQIRFELAALAEWVRRGGSGLGRGTRRSRSRRGGR